MILKSVSRYLLCRANARKYELDVEFRSIYDIGFKNKLKEL